MGVIANLKVGEQTRIRLFAKECSVRKTSSKPPKDYLDVTLTDGEDDINAKMWNYQNVGAIPKQKICYNIVAAVGEYQGKKQLTLTQFSVSDDQDLAAFQLSIGIPIEELWTAIQDAIKCINHPDLQSIVTIVYAKYKNILAASSSAKAVHHVGAGGNLLHTLEVFNIAAAICDACTRYNRVEKIDKSLVLAGALLHDIGKAKVYEIEGPSVDFTYEGHIHDHIVAGILMLQETELAERVRPIVDLLIHIISSHHGKLEYGSPVTPKFIEALIVNHADGLSASIDTIATANKKAAPNSYLTEKLFSFGNYPMITQEHIGAVLKQSDTSE